MDGWTIDWQAVAGLAQAGAIVFAAMVAKSGVGDFLRTRATAKKADIAEEATQIAASLVHQLRIVRGAKILRNALETGAQYASTEKSFRSFEQHAIINIDGRLSQAERLRELGQAGQLYFGDEFELACRRVATGYEMFSQQANGLMNFMNIALERAKLTKNDLTAALHAELKDQEQLVQNLEGDGVVTQAFLEESLSVVRRIAAASLSNAN